MARVALVVAALCGAVVVGSSLAASPSLRLVQVARGFDTPVFVTQAPGEPGRLYVVEQSGRIRVVERGRIRATPFLDVRGLIVAGGEQGLLGLAFPPDYARTRMFYVHYSTRPDGDTVVARYRVQSGRAVPSSRRTILRVDQPYSNHNGGHLLFGPDRRLWVGLGDGGSGGDPENRAQNPDTLLGKMLRLDVRVASPRPEIVALGLRNPWRYSFDRRTGVLWIGDVGQNSIEEIDRLERPGTEPRELRLGRLRGRVLVREQGPRARPARAAGRRVRPRRRLLRHGRVRLPRDRRSLGSPGRYLFGDYCSGNIWSMPAGGGAKRLESVKVPGLSSFGEGLKGELYVVSHGGTIYRFAR